MNSERILDRDVDETLGHRLLAIIVRAGEEPDEGVSWVTGQDETLQLGWHVRPEGHVVAPHAHLPRVATSKPPQEFLLVQRGLMRVDFYDDARRFVCSRFLRAGDCLLLVSGGHGMEMLEPTKLLEVKAGPYVGAASDKTRWEPST